MLPAGKKEDITAQAATSADGAAGLLLPAEVYSIVNLVEDPCCLVLPDSRIQAANPSFLSFVGKPGLQARQQSFTDWVFPQDRPLFQRMLLLAKAKQQVYELNLRLLTPTHNQQPCRLRLMSIGASVGIVITPAKAQPEAGESQEFDRLTPASLVYDRHFNLIKISRQFCHMLGYGYEELCQIDPASLLHPQDLPLFTNAMRSLVRRDQSGFSCELQLRHQEQHYIWIQYTATLVENPGEEPYITAVALDISPLKQREKRLQEEQEDMSLFLDRVTHDMKGPLRSLMALHHIVQLEHGQDSKVMEYFNHYHATVARLNATVSDLLSLSQVKRGTDRISPVNPRTMVQDCLQTLCHLPDFYRINFTIRVEVKEDVFVEARLLQTIIQNLLENAIKYCSETAPKVVVLINLKEGQLIVDVSDNGIGIDEEAQAHIFEMFYRATTRSSGTGLGLYILKNAVDKLKGTIQLRSVPRKGSRFIVRIPYVSPSASAELQ
ncbi:PAS domain-containing sensor histidine kinase [Cesiribacter andamanensis]|uniref:histidine kinase n=1 Tax=Cesiribacter andamanensis AMV16 TaxID=1279009 RepID=M7N109_9BACT|nr:PAS domain-containing sensor histidine kinase [Cesiribacter andamanensis]EMR00992.1 Signal transduction histidine-protein kinase BarA [Cesiribacter andamanensis AMV16]